MTAHDMSRFRQFSLSGDAPRHAIGETKLAQRLVLFNPVPSDLERLLAHAEADLGVMASPAAVRRVLFVNPDTVAAIARRAAFDPSDPRGEGFIAWLPLNEAGLDALYDGSFDALEPDPAFITGQHAAPAAIYMWAIHAPGRLAGGLTLAIVRLSSPLTREADLYARAASPEGHRLLQGLGFERGVFHGRHAGSDLYVFRRGGQPDTRPIYDSYPGKPGEETVGVARNLDDLAKVMSIRSAVYVAEQSCPYDEEFDGNDLCATHLIGYVGNEPAASIRVRFFADFAKLERLSVRREYRRSGLAFALVRAGIELSRVKGYRRIYGHAQKRLVPFWRRFGARVMPTKEFVFSDFDYVEMLLEAEPHPAAIAIGADP